MDNSSSSLAGDILNGGSPRLRWLHFVLRRGVMESLQMALIGPVTLARIKPPTNAAWRSVRSAATALIHVFNHESSESGAHPVPACLSLPTD